jgi:hypothetical protein
MPWFVMGLIVAVLVAGGVASEAFKEEPPEPFETKGSRAVVVPTFDRARTVVVPPCSPETQINRANAASQIEVPGAVAVSLPKGPRSRAVVIPRCAAQVAASPGAPNVPSSAFVLAGGQQVSPSDDPDAPNPVTAGVRQQVTVASGSPVTTIVAAPCQGTAEATRTTVLSPEGNARIAIAPGC